jgi:hypothetical protein
MPAGELRRAVPSRVRANLDDALDALVLSGDIEAEATEYHGRSGTRYRLRGRARVEGWTGGQLCTPRSWATAPASTTSVDALRREFGWPP